MTERMGCTHQAATLWLLLALGACGPSRTEPTPAQREQPPLPAPQQAARALIPQDAPRDAAVRTEDLAPLPEDEDAGKRSEAQWREHLEYEEWERQIAFDQPRLAQHRALERGIKDARRSYDRARNARALDGARKQVAGRLTALRARVTQLDPWGVNSRLLGDYAELFTLLEQGYPDAAVKALAGEPAALAEARERFDARLEHVKEWLEEVEREHEGEREGEQPGEREREREQERERERERERKRD